MKKSVCLLLLSSLLFLFGMPAAFAQFGLVPAAEKGAAIIMGNVGKEILPNIGKEILPSAVPGAMGSSIEHAVTSAVNNAVKGTGAVVNLNPSTGISANAIGNTAVGHLNPSTGIPTKTSVVPPLIAKHYDIPDFVLKHYETESEVLGEVKAPAKKQGTVIVLSTTIAPKPEAVPTVDPAMQQLA